MRQMRVFVYLCLRWHGRHLNHFKGSEDCYRPNSLYVILYIGNFTHTHLQPNNAHKHTRARAHVSTNSAYLQQTAIRRIQYRRANRPANERVVLLLIYNRLSDIPVHCTVHLHIWYAVFFSRRLNRTRGTIFFRAVRHRHSNIHRSVAAYIPMNGS